MTNFQKAFAVLCFLAAVCLVVIAPSIARAADKECVIATKEEFFMKAQTMIEKSSVVHPDKLKVFIGNVNAGRAKNKLVPLEADMMLVAKLRNGAIGTVMFKNNCVVPGTILSQDEAKTREFFAEMKSEHILDFLAADS